MKEFVRMLKDIWTRVVIGVQLLLGDTRTHQVRSAPYGSMVGQNKAPNRHNKVVMTNEYYQRPQETVMIPQQPSMAKEYTFGSVTDPIRDARKPVLDRTDLPSAAFFSSLVGLGLFDRRCNLNGFTASWGFQVLYDKQELRMFRYPVVHHSPTVILSAEGMTRTREIDFPLGEVYSILSAMRDHVRAQKLVPFKELWVVEYEKLVSAGLYHPDLDLTAIPGDWTFTIPEGLRELRIFSRGSTIPFCIIDEDTGQPVVSYSPELEEWQKYVLAPLLYVYPYIAVKNLNDKEKQ